MHVTNHFIYPHKKRVMEKTNEGEREAINKSLSSKYFNKKELDHQHQYLLTTTV